VDALQPQSLQTQTGQTRQIGLELAFGLCFKQRSNRRRTVIKGVQHVSADLKSFRSDAWPQPSQNMRDIVTGL
jgi:hypothetical protein